MKTITIQIQVPDGVTVNVAQIGHDDEPPFPSEPTPFRGAAIQQPSTAWQEGQVHVAGHKPLKTNARGLFCPTKVQDGSWCDWRAS